MGNYCSSGDSQTLAYGEVKICISLHRIVRLQANVRRFLARKMIEEVRTSKIKSVISKYLCII